MAGAPVNCSVAELLIGLPFAVVAYSNALATYGVEVVSVPDPALVDVTYLFPWGSYVVATRDPNVTSDDVERRKLTSDEDTLATSERLFAMRSAPTLDVWYLVPAASKRLLPVMWMYPEAGRLVPEAEVKASVGNKPYPLADIFVVDTLVAVRFVKVGLTETPMVSPPVVDVTTWMMVPEEFTWLKIRGRDVVE